MQADSGRRCGYRDRTGTLAGHLAKARYLLIETIENGMDAGSMSDCMHQAETVLNEMSAALA